jgi:(S)-ureidoglycine aminohydrolase
MRPVNQVVHSRARVRQRYALMPLEGFPVSRLPTWPDAEVKVLAAPALGAAFVQYLIDLPAGKSGEFFSTDGVETFYFILDGSGEFRADEKRDIRAGSFGLTPPGVELSFQAADKLRLIILRKRVEPIPGVGHFASVYGNESEVKKEVWADNSHSLLQTLIPDDFVFDMAMNLFTFDPGFGLPVVETHVMEHGLYFLEGKGVYYLDGEWMEVERDDFIWMGPYCPQSFYATGPTPARYLYYKNVNREISL